ncbi:RluA family pseudouridine synthase [bacterium]|nr:RluA family pseudouridine synthase [bacterium]
MAEQLTLHATSDSRLDVFLAESLPAIDRLEARRWIEAGRIAVEGSHVKPSLRLWPGAAVHVTVPGVEPSAVIPEDLPLEILYADDELVVVNKPAGMATHPGPGWWSGSVFNALLFQIPYWPGISGVAQPGVVHRLDRDTSGLLVLAKAENAHRHLLAQVLARTMERGYLAWIEGELEGEGLIDAPIGRDPELEGQMRVTPDGKDARTRYRTLGMREGRTLVELKLETGRTHQIRVHMAHLGHPILGDIRYHPAPEPGPMALHAAKLSFEHPSKGPMAFEAVPPEAWAAFPALFSPLQ